MRRNCRFIAKFDPGFWAKSHWSYWACEEGASTLPIYCFIFFCWSSMKCL